MRPLSVLLCAAGLAVVASGAGAQTLPSWGCNASPSCRQNGFSTVTGQYKEHTGVLFDVNWDHGLKFDLLRHPSTRDETPRGEQWFHLHPPSTATPPAEPRPAVSPAPAPTETKDGETAGH
jgi:hypothetical protein